MLTKTYGSAIFGIEASTITIEVNVSNGTKYAMVGLPDNAVKESWHRIQTAIENNGFKFPRRKIVVNLAPADIRKEGSSYDLPIAMGVLIASETVVPKLEMSKTIIMGELSLDGTLLPVKGALPIAIKARQEGYEHLILPKSNAREAAIVDQLKVFGVSSLQEVVNLLEDPTAIAPTFVDTREEFKHNQGNSSLDFSDVKGQKNVKRAMEIAAAGGHNVVLIGPPGAGKTMLAKRLPSILPPLSLHEALETTKIHSVAGKLSTSSALMHERPFRAPHHTVSDVALVGGGNQPQPGEISLAHNGVLFLDELPEFKRSVLEVLRQPLEDREINISRARFSVTYPAGFLLACSLNPCPCGYYNHPKRACNCAPGIVQKYLGRISGPLMDRIDLHVEVVPVEHSDLASEDLGESSTDIRERVIAARTRQNQRFAKLEGVHCNAHMTPSVIREECALDNVSRMLLSKAMDRLQLSARAHDRILKVARTIADLAESDSITMEHIAEAIQFRSLDREDWQGA